MMMTLLMIVGLGLAAMFLWTLTTYVVRRRQGFKYCSRRREWLPTMKAIDACQTSADYVKLQQRRGRYMR